MCKMLPAETLLVQMLQKFMNINPLTLTARFNYLFPQCSQVTLTLSAFNAQGVSRWLFNQLVIYKTCLAYFSDFTSE